MKKNKCEPKKEIIESNDYDYLLNKNFPPLVKEITTFLNILEIDEFLKKKFKFEYDYKIQYLEKKLEIESKKLNKKLFMIEKITISNNIDKIKSEIESLLSNTKLKDYLEQTSNILNLYKELGPKKKVISFSMTKSDKKSEIDNKDQIVLIEKYISIAKYFHPITISYPESKLYICNGCGNDISKLLKDSSGICICEICGVEKPVLMQNIIISENRGIALKEGYEDRENFEKALYRFQGKQINPPPKRLYKELDQYFLSFNPPLPVGEEIKKLPLLPNGTKKGTSHSMIIFALGETNNSAFYEDVNLICHLYWGYTLPDLSKDEENIMNDYDETQEVYRKIPKERKSSLNTQYRLCQHLKIRGYNYPLELFKMVKTPEILADLDRIMEIMCKECNLPFTPIS
jgi:hypothetical protein